MLTMVTCRFPLPNAANDLSSRMSRKAKDSGDQEFGSFDHVKVIHADCSLSGLSSISTAAFDEDQSGAMGQGFSVCIFEELAVCTLTYLMC